MPQQLFSIQERLTMIDDDFERLTVGEERSERGQQSLIWYVNLVNKFIFIIYIFMELWKGMLNHYTIHCYDTLFERNDPNKFNEIIVVYKEKGNFRHNIN